MLYYIILFLLTKNIRRIIIKLLVDRDPHSFTNPLREVKTLCQPTLVLGSVATYIHVEIKYLLFKIIETLEDKIYKPVLNYREF